MGSKEDKPRGNDEKTIFEQEGSSRAVTSGFYFFMFSIVGSFTLFIFNVIATDNDGLAYFGLISAIVGIAQLFSSGFNPSFLAKVKSAYVEDPKLALVKASSYFRIYIFIGIIIAVSILILALITPDTFFQINLLMAVPPVIITYSIGLIGNMISVQNRFDVAAFIGSFYGVVVFIVGLILISTGSEAVLFTFIPLIVAIWGTLLTIIFFRRISPFSIKDMYIKGKTFSKESTEFLKDTSYSTLTSLESIGVLGNIIVVMTAISLSIYSPGMRIVALQIMTIIMTYVIAAKIGVIFFAGPFNIEIAEAIAKDNKEIIQQTITDIGRISSIIGLTLLVFLCGLAGHFLRILHLGAFIEGNVVNEQLLLSGQLVFIMFSIGQSCFGFSALFGNALIGGGHAGKSAIGFTIALILTLILTPIFNFFFGFIGAGMSMTITGLILLPYMLITLKKSLNVKLNFRVVNQIPYLAIIFLLLIFYPLAPVLDHITFVNNNLPVALIGLLMLLGIFFAFIIGLPFFGVMGPGDGKLIRDITNSFGARRIGNFLINTGRFFYYLNPLHKKSK